MTRIDPTGGAPTEFAHDPADPSSLGPGYVRAMLVDRANRFWVGSGEGGLQEIQADGKVVRRFRHDPADEASLSDDYVTVIHEDRRGKLWVGTRSGGLNSLDPETGTVIRHRPDPNRSGALSHHFVTSIIEDSKGLIWVGTGGGGVNRAEPSGDRGLVFTSITETSGLIDDDVMGLVEDDDGTLWISTKHGVTRFDPQTGATFNLFVADGLRSGEFEPGTAARDGETLYFGSVKGLVAIPTGTRFPPSVPSPTVVTSIRTATGERRGDQATALEIPWGEWVSLRFAVLDYNADRGHRYAYRLGGGGPEWVDLGTGREITFTDLDAGDHRLGVRGRNSQGEWSEVTPALAIRVIPPFWMTTWFRVAALVLLVAAAVGGHEWRMSTVAKRNRELENLTRQREKAREELATAYARLRRLTRRLEVATEEERKHIARELHDEMGPTLTAVIINLQLMARKTEPGPASEKLRDTIDLVDRMVQRVRDLSLDLRPPLLEELGLVPALRGYLEAQGARAQMDIVVNADSDGPSLSQESEINAFRVVQEAVTNVIRHAKATRATVTVHQTGGDLLLAVKDDGRGFNVRDTMEGPAAKALGLLGLQERVFTMGGVVEIDSAPGRGTEVKVRVPLGNGE